jgi:predicted nucleic acid-binding protein
VIVPDASVVVAALVDDGGAGALAREVLTADVDQHVPHLLDLEVASALRGLVLGAGLSAGRASAALDDLADLPLLYYPHRVLLPRVWALRHNASVYDASYLALAELLDAPLVTSDRRLATVPDLRCSVNVLIP